MLKLETLIITIFGFIIAFSVIGTIIMCIVVLIQYYKRKQAQRSHQNSLSLSQRDMEAQDQPTEQDHDEEETKRTAELGTCLKHLHQHTGMPTNILMKTSNTLKLSNISNVQNMYPLG